MPRLQDLLKRSSFYSIRNLGPEKSFRRKNSMILTFPENEDDCSLE
jgi:hypothetical protein